MPAKTEEITLTLGGLHCAACVARVERALSAAPGVELALVKGKRKVDKRQAIKERDMKREMDRARKKGEY